MAYPQNRSGARSKDAIVGSARAPVVSARCITSDGRSTKRQRCPTDHLDSVQWRHVIGRSETVVGAGVQAIIGVGVFMVILESRRLGLVGPNRRSASRVLLKTVKGMRRSGSNPSVGSVVFTIDAGARMEPPTHRNGPSRLSDLTTAMRSYGCLSIHTPVRAAFSSIVSSWKNILADYSSPTKPSTTRTVSAMTIALRILSCGRAATQAVSAWRIRWTSLLRPSVVTGPSYSSLSTEAA